MKYSCSSLSPRLRQISPLAPRILAIARPIPVKSHRRATVRAPHLLFLSGCQLCSNCFYTLPRAIKEKKKNEKGVGHSGVEKEKGEVGQVGFLENKRRREKQNPFLVSSFWRGRKLEEGEAFLVLQKGADGSRGNREEGESKLFRVFREVERRGGSKGVGFSFWF